MVSIGERFKGSAKYLAKMGVRRSSLKILLVDDSSAVLGILERILKHAGYEVTTAMDGQEAIDLFEECGQFDLLISDLVMPGEFQGDDVARLLRRRSSRLPVIFLSGYSSGSLAAQTKAIDGSIYLMKPVTRKKLLETISLIRANPIPE